MSFAGGKRIPKGLERIQVGKCEMKALTTLDKFYYFAFGTLFGAALALVILFIAAIAFVKAY
jgi:hypothetical protein